MEPENQRPRANEMSLIQTRVRARFATRASDDMTLSRTSESNEHLSMSRLEQLPAPTSFSIGIVGT